jgi:LPS sulfotransferase NodH
MGQDMSEIEARGHRIGTYAKDASDEEFLAALNEYLEPRERERYEDIAIAHPFVFVVGAPRSGTTLLSQLLAYCLDVGYVTNVAARFWRAPLHGIRLSRVLVGAGVERPFESDYARTPSLGGIHEFGYFWTSWLQKLTFDDVVDAESREGDIDWRGLRLTLANVQRQFDRPMVAKNVLGAHHARRLTETLGKVLWVVIERDRLDTAVSILDARVRYYGDATRWWSYVPPEYRRLEGLGTHDQIAGQIHYLDRFYRRVLGELDEAVTLRVRYADLCGDPVSVLERVAARVGAVFGETPAVTCGPPPSFPFRQYADRAEDKAAFSASFEALSRASDSQGRS